MPDLLPSHLLSLEQQVYDPAVRRSPELCAPLFAEDFLEFGNSGKVFYKQNLVAALKDEKPFDGAMVIEDFQLKPLVEDVVLATCHLDVRDASGVVVRQSRRSTIWKQFDDRWQQVFHQGTPAQIRETANIKLLDSDGTI